MKDLRITDLSVYYYIASSFQNENYTILSGYSYPYVASGIYLVDGYPHETGTLKIPTVSIEHVYSEITPFQLGTGKTDVRTFIIDVFARSDGERDDVGDTIVHFLHHNIPIYDYNIILSGGNSDVLSIGRPENIVLTSNRIDPNIKILRHTAEIRFDLNVDVSSGDSLIN